MNTYQYDQMILSQSFNTNFAIVLVFTSLSIGSLIGLQLQSYIEVMCVLRGECYGQAAWIHVASLIHPLNTCLFFSAITLMIFSVSSVRIFPLDSVQSAGLMLKTSIQTLRNTASLLLSTSAVLIFITFFIGLWFSSI